MVQNQHREALELGAALNKFKYEETTPEIGREFLGVNIVDDVLNALNADEVLRDLAITSELMLTWTGWSVCFCRAARSPTPVAYTA